MQAVLIIRIHNFSSLIDSVGIEVAVDMVYELRNVASRGSITSMYQDKVMLILPSALEAMSEAKRIMGILCTQNSIGMISSCIPLSASIGYGGLFQAVDGSYWGKEITSATTLSEDAGLREILLTSAARDQLPQVQDVCEL